MSVAIVFETHSISVDNEAGLASGWSDPPLSPHGRDGAAALGARRRSDRLTVVFSSDLRRAVETAEIAFAGSALPRFTDGRLRECDYGRLNGAPVAEIAPRSRFITQRYPEGESYADVVRRVASFLHVLDRYDGERVLLIGHSATRWSLEHLLNGAALEALVDAPFEWREGWEFCYTPA